MSSIATWIEPSATDNVGVITTSNNFNPGATFDVGTTVVNYIFADAAGNPASCSFDVTVIGEFSSTCKENRVLVLLPNGADF